MKDLEKKEVGKAQNLDRISCLDTNFASSYGSERYEGYLLIKTFYRYWGCLQYWYRFHYRYCIFHTKLDHIQSQHIKEASDDKLKNYRNDCCAKVHIQIESSVASCKKRGFYGNRLVRKRGRPKNNQGRRMRQRKKQEKNAKPATRSMGLHTWS